MTMRQESATQADGNPPPRDSSSPPWMELMLSVECRAPDGTTGMSVLRAASLGKSSASKRSSTAFMWRMAQSPRKGMEP